jgi:hypothetical protein
MKSSRALVTVVMFAAIAVTTGCVPPKPPPLHDVVNFTNMDQFQSDLAERVSEKINPEKQPDFKVIVTQAGYPIGTVMRANSTIPISYTACQPSSTPPLSEASNLFPTYRLTSGLAMDFGLNNDVIKNLADFGVSLKDTDTVLVEVKDSQVQIAADQELQKAATNADCQSILSQQSVWIVRGYILGQRSFSTKNETSKDVHGKITKIGNFDVNFGSGNAEVSITDAKPNGFLQVISAVGGRQTSLTFTGPTAARGAGKIYVQRDRLDDPADAALLVSSLAQHGFTVARGVEAFDTAKMPKVTQVRYFNGSDKPIAERVRTLLRQQYPSVALVRIGLPAPAGQLEVWLSRSR